MGQFTDPAATHFPAQAAANDLAELAADWLVWFEGDQDCEPPFFPERRSEIADHLRQAQAVLALCVELRDERDGHRQHQRDAEQALIMLLARSGGTVKFTPAEQIGAPAGGSFVSTHEVGTGNMVLGFVPAKRYGRQVDADA